MDVLKAAADELEALNDAISKKTMTTKIFLEPFKEHEDFKENIDQFTTQLSAIKNTVAQQQKAARKQKRNLCKNMTEMFEQINTLAEEQNAATKKQRIWRKKMTKMLLQKKLIIGKQKKMMKQMSKKILRLRV